MLGRKRQETENRAASPATQAATDPERLDILVPYAPSRAWAGVLALAIVAGATIAWASFARIDSQVQLSGVLVAGDGPAVISAPAGGSVSRLLVAPGTAVGPGTVVADVFDGAGHQIAVRAAGSGTIAAVSVTQGQQVRAGSPIASVDRPGAPLNAVLFAGPAAGLALTDGETTSVAFDGSLRTGVVTSIGRYPLYPAGLRQLFGAAAVPGAPAGAVRLIIVRLAGARAFPGATLTPVAATVTVARQRPLDAILHGSPR